VNGQASEGIGHGSGKFVPFWERFLSSSYHESDRGYSRIRIAHHDSAVPAGLAISVFLYYNAMGFRSHGVGRYLLHSLGPYGGWRPS